MKADDPIVWQIAPLEVRTDLYDAIDREMMRGRLNAERDEERTAYKAKRRPAKVSKAAKKRRKAARAARRKGRR